jgi:hypothetical protein
MKKNTGIFLLLLPVIITLSLYITFYERIATKPSNAGFWLILVLGISVGAAIARIIKWPKANN